MSNASRLGCTALGLAKGCHPGPVAVVTTASIGLTRVFGGQRREALRVGAAVLAGQLAIGWQNDWIDAERDRLAARSDKPISSDLVGRGTVGTAAVLAAAACVPASAALGRRAALAHLVAVASAVSYNAGLKRTVLSILTYGVSFGLLPVVAHDASPREGTTPGWAIAAGALLGMAAHLVNVLPDRDADRDMGVLGVPQRLSPDVSLTLATGLLLSEREHRVRRRRAFPAHRGHLWGIVRGQRRDAPRRPARRWADAVPAAPRQRAGPDRAGVTNPTR